MTRLAYMGDNLTSIKCKSIPSNPTALKIKLVKGVGFVKLWSDALTGISSINKMRTSRVETFD